MTMRKNSLIKEILLSTAAAVVAAININTFINAGNLVPGGFSGISLLITRIAHLLGIQLNYSLIYLLFNIPCVLLVFKTIGKRFTLISMIDVVLTSLLVQLLPPINVTDDLLLISVFGGIIAGISSTLVLLANACGGGTDFIAIYFAKMKQKSVWTEMMFVNATMILISGALFGWESALYSIIFQFVQTQVVNITDTRYHRDTFMIVTSKPEEINEAIIKKFHHSVTIMEGVGGFTHETRKMLYTICGEYETQQLSETILQIDPKAFINITKSSKVLGNFHGKSF